MDPLERAANEMPPGNAAQPAAQAERVCGTCTACCTILGVVELKKPPYARCRHLAACGCAIYAERPPACRTWSCDWLLGGPPGGDERHRPDALGIIFKKEAVPGLGPLQLVYEVWPGAADEPKARFLIKKLARSGPVAVLSQGGPTGQEARFVVASKAEEARIPRIAALLEKSRAEHASRFAGQIDPDYARRTGDA